MAETFTAEAILAIPADRFDRLFTASKHAYEFKLLRSAWHPDKNSAPEAKAVFQHVYELHERAVAAEADGTWPGNSTVKWRGTASELSLRYQRAVPFELGTMYIAEKHILYLVKPEFEALFDNAITHINGLNYASLEMREQFSRLMPSINFVSKSDTVLALLLNKTADVLSLRDVWNHLKYEIDPKHVAWMLSRLHNIAAYLEYTKISHQAICLDTVFVSPEHHSLMLYGGWWYAASLGSTVTKVPAALLDRYPSELRTQKIAISRTDQACIKALGMELLGDTSLAGMSLGKNTAIPSALLKFLQIPPSDSSIRAYSGWMDVLYESFGERKFIPFNVSASDIY